MNVQVVGDTPNQKAIEAALNHALAYLDAGDNLTVIPGDCEAAAQWARGQAWDRHLPVEEAESGDPDIILQCRGERVLITHVKPTGFMRKLFHWFYGLSQTSNENT